MAASVAGTGNWIIATGTKEDITEYLDSVMSTGEAQILQFIRSGVEEFSVLICANIITN